MRAVVKSRQTAEVGRTVLWTSAALALVLAASAGAGERPAATRGAKPLRAESAISIVRQIYDKAARYTAASGTPVEIKVSDCRAIHGRDFARQPYSELFDLAPGRVLQLSATVLSDRSLGVSGANFRAEWTEAPHASDAAGLLAAVRGVSVQEILARLRAEDEGFQLSIEPIVSCSVTATAQGESHSYRAAFLFSPGADETPRFFADPVVHGLSRVARERLPPVRDFAELRGRVDPEGAPLGPFPAKTMTCVAAEASRSNPFITQSDAQEHATGNHASQLGLSGTCRETSTCISMCSPTLRQAACQDSGEIDTTLPRTHQYFKEQAVDGDQQYNAASYCKAALGCAILSCPLGLCQSLHLSLGARGIEGGFNVSGGTPLWNGSATDRFACPPPRPVVEPVPGGSPKPPPLDFPEDPGSEGGDGGGGAGDGCYWFCSVTSTGGGYSENCTLVC